MEVKWKLEGLKEHIDALKDLPVLLQASIIRGVLKDAANTQVKNKVVARLPYGKRKTLASVLKTEAGKNKTSVLIGVHQDEFIARFFEYGTASRHTKNGANRGKITAKPSIEIAIDQQVNEVITYINDEFGDRIATHLQRRIKGAKRKNTKLGT